jgi:hypothetical protein
MTLQLKVAHDLDTDDEVAIDGVLLGDPGDDGNAPVQLGEIKLEEVTGASDFEVTPSGDYLATVAGKNYIVALATVLRRDNGGLDDRLLVVGVPTTEVPGGGEAGGGGGEAGDGKAKGWDVTVTGPYTISVDGVESAQLLPTNTTAEIDDIINDTSQEVGLDVSGDPASTYSISTDTPAVLTASGGATVEVTDPPPAKSGRKSKGK